MITRKNMAFPRIRFYCTLSYNVIMEKISSRRWYDRIDETIILGALPFKFMTSELLEKENVKSVIALNESFELKYWVNNEQEWSKCGVKFLHLPTADFTASPSQSSLEKGINFIKAENEGRVYIHCKAGRTRSATLAACYLIDKYNYSPSTAIQLLKEKRPHIVIRSNNWDSINEFHITKDRSSQKS